MAEELHASEEIPELLQGLNEKQLPIVKTLDKPVFVAAGAGSGKTTTLTRRIVWALSQGSGENGEAYLNSLDEALIITFTDKAAGEIKERVRGALRNAKLYDQALKVDSAWISTIHHMCARILRAHALDLGIDPAFAMVGDQEALVMRADAINRALIEFDDDAEIRDLFTEYPLSAVSADDADNSALGLMNFLLNKASSENDGLDALHFVQAKSELVDDVLALIADYEALCGAPTKNADELNSCQEALDQLYAFRALSPSQRTNEATMELMSKLYRPVYNRWQSKETVDLWRAVTSSYDELVLEAGLVYAQRYQEAFMRLARRVDEIYSEDKRDRGMLDNDDLLRQTARAFKEHPEIAEVYANKFKLVMVDEFQDTNEQQVQMIKGLSGKDACHLATVGDSQQSIYGFRGADVSVFEHMGESFGDDGILRLDQNYRSHNDILRFVASVCGNTGIVPGFMDLLDCKTRKDGFKDDNERPIEQPRVVVELCVGRAKAKAGTRLRIQAAQLADRLYKLKEKGVKPQRMAILMRSLGTAPIFIDALRARGIESVVTGGSTFKDAAEVKVVQAILHLLANPRDTETGLFPVLQSEMFALDASDFLALATKEQEESKSKASSNAADSNGANSGTQNPPAGSPDAVGPDVAGLAAASSETSDSGDAKKPGVPMKQGIYPGILPFMPLYDGVVASDRLAFARQVIDEALKLVGTMDIADVVLYIVRKSGWLARLEKQGVAGRAQAANVLSAIRHIRELTQPAALDAVCAANEFDRWLKAVKEGPASLSGEGLDAVSIMTVHSSKGLEFDVVAVVGCCGREKEKAPSKFLVHKDNTGALLLLRPHDFSSPTKPSIPASASDCKTLLDWNNFMNEEFKEENRREEGRLLYVALTRAKECIILSMSVDESTKENKKTKTKTVTIKPATSAKIIDELFGGELPEAGESMFEYGSVNPGLVRTVTATRVADSDVPQISSNKTLNVTFINFGPQSASAGEATTDASEGDSDGSANTSEGDGENTSAAMENAVTGALAGTLEDAAEGGAQSFAQGSEEGNEDTGAEDAPIFKLFDVDADTPAPNAYWRPREDVFSYSSAHHALQSNGGSMDDFLDLPTQLPLTTEEQALLSDVPKGPVVVASQPSKKKAKEVGATQDAGTTQGQDPVQQNGSSAVQGAAQALQIMLIDEDDDAGEAQDTDRATNFGSAFHELARLMVETSQTPQAEQIDLVAKKYNVQKVDYTRLEQAIARWSTSQIRARALGFDHLRAEVPFFINVASPFGHNLEGAIDLLATNDNGEAMLIDYKTGDIGITREQIRKNHEMQARFYAYVLSQQGIKNVDCCFVCVELEDSQGEPIVTNYSFHA